MIVVLTDFGNSEYVGIMKGTIYSISKNAKVIDLFNEVNPQKIKEGAWILYTSCKYFPEKSVFLCVVDPGVGSNRQAVAIKSKNYFFVGPDNGLMFKAADEDGILDVRRLETKNASKTFHGRDVFAKAAAQIEKGGFEKIGKKTKLEASLDFYINKREGEVVRIDNFGNIITNLPSLNKKSYSVRCKNFNKKLDFFETYSQASENKLFLVEGSAGTLEISIKSKSASERMRLKIGDMVEIT